MILVDTSVWIDHFRSGNQHLVDLLEQQLVVMHPFVAGELACENLPDRTATLSLLDGLPRSPIASNAEVRAMIENSGLFGTGLGWVDLHLLASVRLMARGRLWTLDERLARAH